MWCLCPGDLTGLFCSTDNVLRCVSAEPHTIFILFLLLRALPVISQCKCPTAPCHPDPQLRSHSCFASSQVKSDSGSTARPSPHHCRPFFSNSYSSQMNSHLLFLHNYSSCFTNVPVPVLLTLPLGAGVPARSPSHLGRARGCPRSLAAGGCKDRSSCPSYGMPGVMALCQI